MHLSYCTGQAGIDAAKASSAQNLLASSSSAPSGSSDSTARAETEASLSKQDSSEDRRKKAEALFSKKRLGEGDLDLNEDKLAEAIKAERKRKGRGGEEYEWGTGKKRKGGESHEVTEEELGAYDPARIYPSVHHSRLRIEAYRMNRRMTEDPMANYIDNEA